MKRIAIIGFGYSGNLLLANLVRQSREPLGIYVIDPALTGRGMAYSTIYDQHLLNVRAYNMSAFADDKDDLLRWLQQHAPHYGAQDFIPRRLFGDYLASIWQRTQALAAEKKMLLKLVPSIAVALSKQAERYAVLTERGDAIAVDMIVLATGNEIKPVQAPIERVLQAPWTEGALAQAAKEQGPILLIGTGLTAVDMVLALRAEGYAGEIIAYSRNGLLPHAHRDYGPAEAISADDIAAQHTLRQWAGWLRRKARDAADWRPVFDGLRPFTQSSWQKLRTRQQQLFFRRVASFWSVHRHRMALQIAQQLADDTQFCVMNRKQFKASGMVPTLAINCTGSELNVERSTQPLLKNLLAQRFIEPHANGVGIAVDAQHRAWGEAYPHLFSIGALMTGQLLESTAVPELRVQARTIAEALCTSPPNKS